MCLFEISIKGRARRDVLRACWIEFLEGKGHLEELYVTVWIQDLREGRVERFYETVGSILEGNRSLR